MGYGLSWLKVVITTKEGLRRGVEKHFSQRKSLDRIFLSGLQCHRPREIGRQCRSEEPASGIEEKESEMTLSPY